MADPAKTVAKLRAWAADAREAGAIDVDDLLTSAAAQLENATGWFPACAVPDNAQGLAVICRLRCCYPGELIVVTADRIDGQWLSGIGHSVDFEMWRRLPAIPAILKSKGGLQ